MSIIGWRDSAGNWCWQAATTRISECLTHARNGVDVPDELDPILPAADMSMMTTTGSRGPVASWNTGVGSATDADDDRTWDSGLIGPDDKPRPSLAVLQGLLGVKSS